MRSSAINKVIVTQLTAHEDHRGVFVETFRASWPTSTTPIQWNIVTSCANVLRGFHVHVTHTDYLTCVGGELLIGLKDVRKSSPTFGQTEVHVLRDDAPAALTIPPGVAHGFYSAQPTKHLYSVSHYWNLEDELGCAWDDPEIGIPWPATAPLLSARDQKAGSFRQMVADFRDGRERHGLPA
jgi:dTDP-4-dehydrorhamnose 3,5-epimerase